MYDLFGLIGQDGDYLLRFFVYLIDDRLGSSHFAHLWHRMEAGFTLGRFQGLCVGLAAFSRGLTRGMLEDALYVLRLAVK